ncbi:lethal factor domain protein (plasmid) [Bacillus sp. JAS24-2]|uniref:ADP-ribosyltransferase n=1 Tax=Bacillus sp. JAS24-2 TaxID=2217832 RepID=UPI0011EE8A89|nr:ADP-ribosyltransferase [Bacillus sp. JAS24-2]QEL82852.1 lethal factor domain protein [Bacillus sp. JAS24-2]
MQVKNKFLFKVFSTVSVISLLSVTFATFPKSTYAINKGHIEEKEKEKQKEKDEKKEKNKEEKEKEFIKDIVKPDYTSEKKEMAQQTEQMLEKIPHEVLEMYDKIGGKIYITDKELTKQDELKNLSEKEKNVIDSNGKPASLDSRFVFAKGGKNPALIIRIEDYQNDNEKRKEVYYELGKEIIRDVLNEKELEGEPFIKAVNKANEDSDSRDLLFGESLQKELKSDNKPIDKEFIKKHLTAFQDVFAQAFSQYFESEHKESLKLYAPDMFKYIEELDQKRFKEINDSMENKKNSEENNKDKTIKDFSRDIKAADIWYKEVFKDFNNKLNPEQKASIQMYTTQNYKTINKGLRESNLPEDKEKEVKNISEALNKSSLPEKVVVYRKTGKDSLGLEINTNFKDQKVIENLKNKLEHSTREEKAFLSTSIANHFSESFDVKSVLYKITVPKGTKAAYIFGDLATYQGESELLIDKGYSYEITKISTYEHTKNTGTKQTNLLVEATLLPK